MHSEIQSYSDAALSIIPGSLWRHYKSPSGEYYEIISLARVESTEEEVVIYRAQFGECHTWSRPVPDFLAVVLIDGEEKKRFSSVVDCSAV